MAISVSNGSIMEGSACTMRSAIRTVLEYWACKIFTHLARLMVQMVYFFKRF